ncbi:DUF3116 family protein [Aquibacillus salsiterrae]|uniref:DUF3116 family protein n=1 Tax=Aquibacillus salsiterrae TaxID=2950439 RepID=A0A9X3WHC0_9BACI|nr:DUF3116 family protein [Aquibacillus salsiterrae]MDC3418608.1 DUF3116 family protein [Aquibacillus salsiterrae]
MNLKNYIVNSSNPQFLLSSKGQFIIQRKIFSDAYPDFPDVLTLKLYLYLCRSFEWKYMRIKKAKSTIQSNLNMSRASLNKSLYWLEQNHFIKRSNQNKHQMYQAELLTVPDYCIPTQQYISREDVKFHSGILKIRNHGYIMIPSEAITNKMLRDTATARRRWSLLKVKVFILLYSHCWLEYFGGINPDVISIDKQTHKITVDASFCYNVKATEKQVITVILSLLKEKHVKVVPAIFKSGVFMGDYGFIESSRDLENRLILRPFLLSGKKFEKQEMINKKKYMIL